MENPHQTNWPVLSYEKGKDTYKTVHLFSQIIGKIKLKSLPWINHSWHVALIVTPSGLTTSLLPYGERHFQIEFDFCQHKLRMTTNMSEMVEFKLEGLSVAEFYKKTMDSLASLKIDIKINRKPNEIPDAVVFDEDHTNKTYDKEQVTLLHRALMNAQTVFTDFRSEFKGKCSPIHFFWGSFDLAVTRFSGRKAPTHPGGVPNLPDSVAEEAYSHEVISCGFWPGNDALPQAVFYSYSYPEPDGFKAASILPIEAYYNTAFGEFILPYEAVQKAANPREKVLEFLRSTYQAGAGLGNWDIESFT